ncbi:uncharacterized protein GLRG_11262 [Colletotrichum graminicola M1.001]|uniref:Uncharacterized protein n=1 Tax=Colletotrichum graminicola (strain M1.001 / M2 / FGSC 10212) TaxID=645133 RepID=E3QZ30_COLGM|nr:uncharacterized protein GLRG_11262 [Colletotrichum graminicola M1.001]EFQ36118.1 hypothetical protein GLRG_11262 [Colletotrichum graminicola M1.001]
MSTLYRGRSTVASLGGKTFAGSVSPEGVPAYRSNCPLHCAGLSKAEAPKQSVLPWPGPVLHPTLNRHQHPALPTLLLLLLLLPLPHGSTTSATAGWSLHLRRQPVLAPSTEHELSVSTIIPVDIEFPIHSVFLLNTRQLFKLTHAPESRVLFDTFFSVDSEFYDSSKFAPQTHQQLFKRTYISVPNVFLSVSLPVAPAPTASGRRFKRIYPFD